MALITTNYTEALGPQLSGAYSVLLSFTRSSLSAAAYGAGTVISDSGTTAKALQFGKVGLRGRITNASISCSTDFNGGFLNLFLFDREPTNFVDQAVLNLTLADHRKLLGVLSFTTMQSSLSTNPNPNMKWLRAVGPIGEGLSQPLCYTNLDGNIHGLLTTALTTVTPTASTEIDIRLSIERDL